MKGKSQKKILEKPEKIWEYLMIFLCRILGLPESKAENRRSLPDERTNPYILQTRGILEQILTQKNISYRDFRPIVIDTDCPDQEFGEPDDVDLILEQLRDGLNFLEICTKRPEHFTTFCESVWNESGLLVRLLPDSDPEQKYGNVVLDLEREGLMHIKEFERDVLYLPFYKRVWKAKNGANSTETGAGNLDIEVPIGYNMLIVKSIF